MTDPDIDLSIGALLDNYRAGRLNPTQVAVQALAAADRYPDPAVWIARLPPGEVLAQARRLAARPQGTLLPLYGVPFAVKDNIDVAGLETTAACPAFAYRASRHAPVVERLLESGAMLIGKTNLDQFATGLVGARSPYGAPGSVFDRRYISGGSSSGSGVAVGAHLVSFALGTDTAGSGRVPAAFNNVLGLKPSRGLISTTGLVPACRSLDCVSIFAQSAGDALAVLNVAAAPDDTDPWSRTAPPRLLPLDRPRVGILADGDRLFDGDGEADRLYQQAIEAADSLGWDCRTFDYRPFREAARSLYGGPRAGERLAGLAEFVRDHADRMDPVVRSIIAGAGTATNVDAYRADHALASLRLAAEREWRRMDLMLLPTTPAIYTKAAVAADPIALNSRLGDYTNFVNLMDLCAIALPAGFRPSNGLPFGVTLIAPAFADLALTVLGDRLHRAIGAGAGLRRTPPRQSSTLSAADLAVPETVKLAVAGAHLSGMPLNHQLTDLGAIFLAATRTASDYKLFALPDTTPPKPGLARAPGFAGQGVEVEIWLLTGAAFGAFVARLPQPMGVGQIRLEDGEAVSGFLCEAHALTGAEDITRYGGWKAYLAAGPSA